MKTVFIGLGSNLNNPVMQLNQAVNTLRSLSESEIIVSSYYQTVPMGPEQPDFINAVVRMTTMLDPQDLLHALQSIENQQGRVREQRWGPRTLDLDILLYESCVINTPRLTIPHVGLTERAFVLCPLTEIAPDLALPNGTRIIELIAQNDSGGVNKLEVIDA